MRKRLARKIYFPSDVGLAYRATTMDRAFRRLRMGNRSKWRLWSEVKKERENERPLQPLHAGEHADHGRQS